MSEIEGKSHAFVLQNFSDFCRSSWKHQSGLYTSRFSCCWGLSTGKVYFFLRKTKPFDYLCCLVPDRVFIEKNTTTLLNIRNWACSSTFCLSNDPRSLNCRSRRHDSDTLRKERGIRQDEDKRVTSTRKGDAADLPKHVFSSSCLSKATLWIKQSCPDNCRIW